MAERGRYLYAVTRGTDPATLADVHGLEDAPVETVEHRGLLAVVSSVDLDDYGEEGLRRNLEDLGWLERVARGHDAVIQATAAHGPTAPMRLATIFRDDAGVQDRLEEWHDALHDALDRVDGRAEWSVKTYARTPGEAPAAEPESSAAEPGKGAGLAYLQRKKGLAERQAQSQERALQLAEEVHDALSSLSVASRRLQPQDPRLTGHEGTMTLNGAYLVEEADGEEFASAARRLSEEHPETHLVCAGPWPPYSFATLEQP
jgi:hypothetical protein